MRELLCQQSCEVCGLAESRASRIGGWRNVHRRRARRCSAEVAERVQHPSPIVIYGAVNPGEHTLRKHRKDHHKPEVYGSFPLWCSGRSGDSFRCFRFVLPISRTVCSRTVRPPFGPRGLTAILSDERQMGDTVFARGRRKRSQSESHGPRMAFEPFALSTFRRRLKLSDARRTRRQGTGSRSESFWSRSSQD